MAIHWRAVEGLSRATEIIGMMVAIVLQQRLERHAEILSSLPRIGAELHLPGCGRVTKNVRSDVREPSGFGDVPKRLVDIVDRVAIPFDGVALPKPFPTQWMR